MRKLFFTIVALLLCTVGAWADNDYTDYLTTGNGWTKVTSTSEIVTDGSAVYVIASEADKTRVVSISVPGSDAQLTTSTISGQPSGKQVWFIESDSYNSAAGYAFKNVAKNGYYLTAGSMAWDQHPTATAKGVAGTCYTLLFDGDYHLQIKTNNSIGTDVGRYWGWWDTTTPSNSNYNIAGNKGDRDIMNFALYKKELGQTNKDYSFLAGNTTFDDNAYCWNSTGGFTNTGITSNNPSSGNGVFESTKPFWENWRSGGAAANKMYQTISDIPNGKYKLGIDAFVNALASPNESQYVFANDDKTYLTSSTPTSYEVTTLVTDHSLSIGLEQTTATTDWMGIDNIRLTYLGNNISYYSPSSFTTGTEATADTWYVFTVPSNGWYVITPSVACTFSYTQDGTMPFDSQFPRFYAPTSGKKEYLTAGTFYFKTSTDATVSVESTSIDANDDLTYLLTNPSFEDNNMNGWTTICEDNVVDPSSLSDCGVKSATDPTYIFTNYDGDYIMNYFGWSWSDHPVNGVQQPLSLPAGSYRIEAVMGGWVNWKMVLDVNGTYQEKTMEEENKGESFLVDVTLATPSVLTITAKTYHYGNNAWEACFMKADNFRLYSLDHYYDALNAAITAAEAHTLGFEVGEYAPYNNTAAIAALNAAKAVNQANYDISWSELQAIVSNLTSATWTVNTELMDAIYDGKFANTATGDVHSGVTGWTTTGTATGDNSIFRQVVTATNFTGGKGLYFWPTTLKYGETTGYTMPLTPNSVYRLSFAYGGWESGTNSPSITLTNESGNVISSLQTGTALLYTEGITTYTIYFATGASRENYTFKFTSYENTNTVIGDLSLVKVDALTFADGSVPNYVAGTYPTVKISRTLTADRWATAVYPFAVRGVDNIAVLSSFNAGTGSIRFATASESVANEPFLMRSASNKSVITLNNIAVSATTETPTVTKDEASLIGAYSLTEITDAEKNYVLSNNGIYDVGANGATINPYRAYIQIAGGSGARSLVFFVDEETTAIEGLNRERTMPVGYIYNLNGQLVRKNADNMNGLRKGIYIVGGKRITVK